MDGLDSDGPFSIDDGWTVTVPLRPAQDGAHIARSPPCIFCPPLSLGVATFTLAFFLGHYVGGHLFCFLLNNCVSLSWALVWSKKEKKKKHPMLLRTVFFFFGGPSLVRFVVLISYGHTDEPARPRFVLGYPVLFVFVGFGLDVDLFLSISRGAQTSRMLVMLL
jgi:hypothetical protein